MKFDRLEHSKKFVSNPGKRFREKFHAVYNEKGDIELVSDGFEDVKKRMRADAEGTDLPSIIARATAGDPTAFRKDKGFYGDIVDMPKTYAEVLNTVNAGREKFDSLPIEIKEKFGNSFEKWFATFGTDEWLYNHGIVKEVEGQKESKVNENES